MINQLDQLFEDVHLALKQQKYANAMILLRIIGEQWTIWLCDRNHISNKHMHQRQRLYYLQQHAILDKNTLRFLQRLQSTGNRAVHQLQANPQQVIYFLTNLERYVSRSKQNYSIYL
ncbi:MAG: hypothetical protein ABS948_16715 [Solibacillus sp.]